ncbi:hypothetical protein [Ornithinibacillus xuwenensis]|uniref:Uncharacterized protein n=1 Tax=Ornithinibacillus xuwenensis TaxID=3144668 RepID=A0ABU9XGU1_9BACI
MERQGNNLGLSILGALLAAVVGGAIWAIIAIVSDYEIGIVAWGIGGLAGYLVYQFAKGSITALHQIIAVVGSIFGIILGKYFILGYFYNYESVSGMFQSDTMSVFADEFTVLFSGMDFVFILLAVVTAWQLPVQLMQKAVQKRPVIESPTESAAE